MQCRIFVIEVGLVISAVVGHFGLVVTYHSHTVLTTSTFRLQCICWITTVLFLYSSWYPAKHPIRLLPHPLVAMCISFVTSCLTTLAVLVFDGWLDIGVSEIRAVGVGVATSATCFFINRISIFGPSCQETQMTQRNDDLQ